MQLIYCFLLSLVTIVLEVGATNSCNCEPRYLQHYEAKGCTPVFNEASECRCPRRYDCPEININPNTCILDGITYEVGEPVNTSRSCQICNCRTDVFHSGATVECINIECPHVFRPPSLEDTACYLEYKEGQCCPTRKCDPRTGNTKVCEHGGKVYRIGQNIYSDTDPCLTCRCTENWTGLNNESCTKIKCELEREIYNFKRGCIPIYHEKTCCPIEYHCPPESLNDSNNESVIAPPNAENMCYFNGEYYSLGELLNISHPTSCVTCKCNTPPDFTCVHRSCPGPPNNDYKNCVSNYLPNTCCAEYTCSQPPTDNVSVEGAMEI